MGPFSVRVGGSLAKGDGGFGPFGRQAAAFVGPAVSVGAQLTCDAIAGVVAFGCWDPASAALPAGVLLACQRSAAVGAEPWEVSVAHRSSPPCACDRSGRELGPEPPGRGRALACPPRRAGAACWAGIGLDAHRLGDDPGDRRGWWGVCGLARHVVTVLEQLRRLLSRDLLVRGGSSSLGRSGPGDAVCRCPAVRCAMSLRESGEQP